MPSRRSHEKSHHGCVICKRRRVKCDELRPSCRTCLKRGSECQYQSDMPMSPNILKNDSPSGLHTIHPVADDHARFQAVLRSRTATAPREQEAVDSFTADQLYELRLMNHYTAVVWRSLVDSDEVQHIWQVVVPKEASQHAFLMHAILSLSALHLASQTRPEEEQERQTHQVAGLRHHSLSIASFRPAIEKLTPDNATAAFAYSTLLAILAFALPKFSAEPSGDVLNELLANITLFQGIAAVLGTANDWVAAGPLGYLVNDNVWNQGSPVPEDFAAAILRLKAHNISVSPSDDQEVKSCGQAIEKLQMFVERLHAHPLDRPSILGFFVVAPDSFITLLRDRNFMALVILAHYCVILNELDEAYWWAGGRGKLLLQAIVQRLHNEWKELVRWPCTKIGITLEGFPSRK